MGQWQDFLNSAINVDNDIQVLFNRAPLLKALETEFNTALDEICELKATKDFEAFDAKQAAEDFDKKGDIVLDFKDGKNETIVINVLENTMHLNKPLPVEGDAGNLFIFRWSYSKDEYTGLCTYSPGEKVEFKETGGASFHKDWCNRIVSFTRLVTLMPITANPCQLHRLNILPRFLPTVSI